MYIFLLIAALLSGGSQGELRWSGLFSDPQKMIIDAESFDYVSRKDLSLRLETTNPKLIKFAREFTEKVQLEKLSKSEFSKLSDPDARFATRTFADICFFDANNEKRCFKIIGSSTLLTETEAFNAESNLIDFVDELIERGSILKEQKGSAINN